MIVRLGATLLLAWAFGFVLFAIALPESAADDVRTDGIVVLTGAPGRVPRGLALLGAEEAERMLISGVGRRVGAEAIARTYAVPAALRGRIDLGRFAVDTRSNAQETAAWIAAQHYRSIRLVTSDWHMRRARFELRRVVGDTRIVADAVPSAPSLAGLLREYDKYLLRRAAAAAGL